MNISTIDWAYAAAMIDGEGTIGLHNSGYCFVSVRMSSIKVIQWLHHTFEGGSFGMQRRPPNSSWKDLYKWYLMRRPYLDDFLKGIEPYLKEKGEQARIAINYNPQNFERDFTRMAFLNKKGK